LDNLETQANSPWVKTKLHQLFDYRYTAELPTVITTAESLDEMDPRLRSRMDDRRLCTIYGITAPSYRGLAQEHTKKTRKRTRSK
jgi:DNA replication protein DnaC